MHTEQPLVSSAIDGRGVATVTLERADRHNALSAALIDALAATLATLEADESTRVVVLTGAGASFCAGADLAEMRAAADASVPDNERDARRLAQLLERLDRLAKPTLARINGNAFGGAIGLIAACDVAVTVAGARFALTEVRLGLVPAMISPYVVRAIGERQARRWFLTAEAFDGSTAEALGLVNRAVQADQLDSAVESLVVALLAGAPGAQAEAKRLIRHVTGRDEGGDRALTEDTIRWIARLRAGEEGREGLDAFLHKRSPRWRS